MLNTANGIYSSEKNNLTCQREDIHLLPRHSIVFFIHVCQEHLTMDIEIISVITPQSMQTVIIHIFKHNNIIDVVAVTVACIDACTAVTVACIDVTSGQWNYCCIYTSPLWSHKLLIIWRLLLLTTELKSIFKLPFFNDYYYCCCCYYYYY